jgi:uncharacterized membrane protein
MDYYMLVLRIVHVGAGVMWAGASWTVAGFLSPAVKATGESGQQVMQQVTGQQRLSDVIGISAALTTLAGALLLWRDSAGLAPAWFRTGPGLALTFGALAGLATFFLGLFGHRRLSARMAAVAGQINSADGPPDPALLAELQSLDTSMEKAGVWSSILLGLAVLGMAAAQVMVI